MKDFSLIALTVTALSFAIAIVFPAKADSIGANVSLTIGEWVQFALWKLEANGLTGPIFGSSRPFEREEVARIVADMKKRIEDGQLSPSPLELELIRKLEAEFARDLRPEGLEVRGLLAGEADYHDGWDSPSTSLWGAASFHPTPGVTLYEEVDIGKGRGIIGEEGETASRRTKTWRWDYTADFRRAYIRLNPFSLPDKGGFSEVPLSKGGFRGIFETEIPLKIPPNPSLLKGGTKASALESEGGKRGISQKWQFEALLGRQSIFWGPGYGGSLIVSDNSPAFDMVFLKARFGPVKAIAFSAILDKMWSEHGDPPYRYLANRYLSGHRIDWIVSDRMELGLSELILYGGEARGMELQYINPLLPYYASQWNSNKDDNVLVSADFAIRPVDRLKVYGQFLVDDFNYTDHDPNALGYIAGVYLSDPFGISGTDVRAEYTRIDTWTYTHLETENQFTHYGWVIGHHLGPDADQLFIELSRMINVDARLKLTYAFGRQGGRTVADRFRGEDYKRMKFPSGTVERQHSIGLQFLWEPLRGPQVNLSCQRVLGRDNTVQEGELSFVAGFLSGI